MDAYEVTQALMMVGTTYHVRRPRQDAVLYTVRGALMSPTPRFHLVEGDAGREVAVLQANFVKTKYEVLVEDRVVASVVFPAVAFKKTLTLTVGGAEYTADGGVFKGAFQCRAGDGPVVLEITKEVSLRDTFLVTPGEGLPLEVGLLGAVAIHSRFYEMV